LQISRKQAYPAIRQHRVAYSDLLYSGLVYETNRDLEIRQQTVLQFQSDTIANYFIALRLANIHTEVGALIQAINESPFDDHMKTEQLKWLLLFQIRSGDFQLVNQLEHTRFIGGDIVAVVPCIG